ncbi:MAG: hypothetical protein AAB909_00920 [Patescibacteria group bacterium]
MWESIGLKHDGCDVDTVAIKSETGGDEKKQREKLIFKEGNQELVVGEQKKTKYVEGNETIEKNVCKRDMKDTAPGKMRVLGSGNYHAISEKYVQGDAC